MQNKRTKTKPEKQDTTRRKTSLAGRTGLARAKPPPEESIQDVPAGTVGTHRGKKHLITHSPSTHIVNQSGVKTQGDYVASIRHIAASFYRKTYR